MQLLRNQPKYSHENTSGLRSRLHEPHHRRLSPGRDFKIISLNSKMVAGTIEGARRGKGTKNGEALFSQMFGLINRVLPGPRKESNYRRDLHSGMRECHVDVAVKNNRVIGVCVYDIAPVDENKVTLLRLVAVDDKHQNHGIGAALFKDMFIKSKGNGASYIISTVREEHLSDEAKLAFLEDAVLLRTVKLPDCTPLVCAMPSRVMYKNGGKEKRGVATLYFYVRPTPEHTDIIDSKELGKILAWYCQQRTYFIGHARKSELDDSLALALAQLDKPNTFFADKFVALVKAGEIQKALDELPDSKLRLVKLSDY